MKDTKIKKILQVISSFVNEDKKSYGKKRLLLLSDNLAGELKIVSNIKICCNLTVVLFCEAPNVAFSPRAVKTAVSRFANPFLDPGPAALDAIRRLDGTFLVVIFFKEKLVLVLRKEKMTPLIKK